jgi:protein SCO1
MNFIGRICGQPPLRNKPAFFLAPRRRRGDEPRMRARHFLAAAMLLAGCDQKAPPAATKLTPVTYDVRGVLHRVEAARGAAIIAHEEIPGYMEAMTMEFTAAAPPELDGLEPGDVVTFRLTVTENDSRIEKVKKVGRTTPPVPPVQSGMPLAGTPLPDVELLDDAGRTFRLADRKGTPLAITFIFTRCPLPDFCPRMNAHFAATLRDLASGSCHFLSVTIDPAHDTPARLAEYARKFRHDSDRWTFAGGEAAEIRKLAAFAGLETKGEGVAITHNLRTLVVDAGGRVTRVFAGNDWQPSELAAELKRAAPDQRPPR